MRIFTSFVTSLANTVFICGEFNECYSKQQLQLQTAVNTPLQLFYCLKA